MDAWGQVFCCSVLVMIGLAADGVDILDEACFKFGAGGGFGAGGC